MEPAIRIVLNAASRAEATELAWFAVEVVPGGILAATRLLHRERPGGAAPEVRAAAVREFRNIIANCVEQERDGLIEVGPSDGIEGPQYCLVVCRRNGHWITDVVAVISRCRDLWQAKLRLEMLRQDLR